LDCFRKSSLSAQNNSSDERTIKKVIQQQRVPVTNTTGKTLSGYFTDDGMLIDFAGQFWKGRNEILAHFKSLSRYCLEPTSLTFDVKMSDFLRLK